MSDSIDRVFVKAINTIKALSTRRGAGSLPPPPLESRIRLYGLYKQATEGNVEGLMSRPSGPSPDDVANRRKWDAWKEEEGISKTEAKRRYISFLIKTMHTYASDTPELRELLSDLEYLWDQVKDIQPSSSSSSDSVAMPPIASTPHYLPVSSRSARSVDRESSVDQTPSEGGTAALTAANLMTYNQQQQQQQQNVRVTSSSRPQRVPRPGSFAGSYSSAGKHNHKKYQGSSKRSSKYHDNPIPGINPPPLYSAQSYISGGESVNSRAAETVNTAAATGLPPTTPNQKVTGDSTPDQHLL